MRFHTTVLLFCFAVFLKNSLAQTWVELTPASANIPEPRANASAVYDPVGHRMIVFGGRTSSGNRNDVWAFDFASNNWSEITPTAGPAPAPRLTANAIYDPTDYQLIVWSGQGSSFFNDIWSFDLSSHVWRNFSPPDPKPSIRYGAASIFDPIAQSLITFAGFTDQGRFDDTWQFDIENNSWMNLTPSDLNPLRRCLHSASYDAQNHRMIIYGGQNSGARDDIWAFDLEQNSWEELTPQDRPAGRWFPTNIYHPGTNRAIIFGGNTGSARTNEVWAFDLNTNFWQEILPTGDLPAPREGAVAIYIQVEDRMVVFGGRGSTYFNDCWSLNNLSLSVSVESTTSEELPLSFQLLRNYPNPFSNNRNVGHSVTVIRFKLPTQTQVSLKIYDTLGRQVKNLVDENLNIGSHNATWNGKNDLGMKVNSGIYFYVLRAGSISLSRKMVVVE